jgi:hypothetical protein
VIDEYPLLTDAECAKYAAQVKELSDYYLDRGGFSTLGAAVYRDDPLLYPTLAKLLNPFIARHFLPLLQKQIQFFSEHLNREPVWFDKVAFPGFHVFDYQANELQGFIHTDTPEQNIDWPIPYAEPFSYTLPLELPKLGGGLNLWPDSGITEHTHPDGQGEPLYFPYSIGTLYLHSGSIPHQIANTVSITHEDYRITVQGHGVLLGEDRFTLFF